MQEEMVRKQQGHNFLDEFIWALVNKCNERKSEEQMTKAIGSGKRA